MRRMMRLRLIRARPSTPSAAMHRMIPGFHPRPRSFTRNCKAASRLRFLGIRSICTINLNCRSAIAGPMCEKNSKSETRMTNQIRNSNDESKNDRLNRRNVLALIACSIFLAVFAAISWSALSNKCRRSMNRFILLRVDTNPLRRFPMQSGRPAAVEILSRCRRASGDMNLDLRRTCGSRCLPRSPPPAVHYVRQIMYQTPGTDADALFAGSAVSDAGGWA